MIASAARRTIAVIFSIVPGGTILSFTNDLYLDTGNWVPEWRAQTLAAKRKSKQFADTFERLDTGIA